MKPDAFLKKLADDNAVQPGKHEIARPLPHAERGRWKARHPGLKLPNDFLSFLKRANGVRLGTAGRLLPLREIDTATSLLYQDQEEEGEALPATWLALSDDADGDAILVIDVRKRVYLALDPADPEDVQEVGLRFEEALDWIVARYLDL